MPPVAAEQHRRPATACPPLPAAVAGACLLLTLLLLSQQRLQIDSHCGLPTRQAGPQHSIRQGSGSSGGTATATSPTAAGGGAAARACQPPDVATSPWADSCQLLRDACVDQGTVILYGEEHRMTADQPGTAPFLIEPEEHHRKYIFLHRYSAARDYRYALAPTRVRPASASEGAPYLADPLFSECTIPVVWYPMWASNMAHFFRDNAAKLWGLMQETLWAADHMKLVLVTAEGHAAPEMNYQIAQPLLSLSVETWADFSARLPGGVHHAAGIEVPGSSGDNGGGTRTAGSTALRPSFEGGQQRCFRSLFVCARGLNITRWPLHGLGQKLARHYRTQLPALLPEAPPVVAASSSAVAAEGSAAPSAAANHGGGSNSGGSSGSKSGSSTGSSSASTERILRIIFHKRSSADRQLLNAAELVQRCNAWRHTTSGGQRLRASCQEIEMADLFTGMAAAQQADIFVAVHGANQANGWLMRPGSAMIELQPFGFDAGAAHLQYPLFNMEDADTQVQWWLISICDPQAWTPGVGEAARQGRPDSWPKFRNLVVSWEALQRALQEAVEVAGDMAEYRRRWEEGRWWWWLGPGGSMQFVGKGRRTQLRCPADMTAIAGQASSDSSSSSAGSSSTTGSSDGGSRSGSSGGGRELD
ncbi:hypothetical protein ABPG75_011420 [Micractinium tetrahymenae]